jgi:hypothetical protein
MNFSPTFEDNLYHGDGSELGFDRLDPPPPLSPPLPPLLLSLPPLGERIDVVVARWLLRRRTLPLESGCEPSGHVCVVVALYFDMPETVRL